MRVIPAAAITETVAELCIKANTRLPDDIIAAMDKARSTEPWPLAKQTLGLLWDNLELAEQKNLPYSVAEARRVTWQLTLTATGRLATWVGADSMETPRQVVRPPKP